MAGSIIDIESLQWPSTDALVDYNGTGEHLTAAEDAELFGDFDDGYENQLEDGDGNADVPSPEAKVVMKKSINDDAELPFAWNSKPDLDELPAAAPVAPLPGQTPTVTSDIDWDHLMATMPGSGLDYRGEHLTLNPIELSTWDADDNQESLFLHETTLNEAQPLPPGASIVPAKVVHGPVPTSRALQKPVSVSDLPSSHAAVNLTAFEDAFPSTPRRFDSVLNRWVSPDSVKTIPFRTMHPQAILDGEYDRYDCGQYSPGGEFVLGCPPRRSRRRSHATDTDSGSKRTHPSAQLSPREDILKRNKDPSAPVYKELGYRLPPWGSRKQFGYRITGELNWETRYDPKDLEEFIYSNPRKLVLRIGRQPLGCNLRYGDRGAMKCRFKCCLDPNGTLEKGIYRVTFDELCETHPHHDPMWNAGIVHLWCLERFLDFPQICAKHDVRMEERDFHGNVAGVEKKAHGMKLGFEEEIAEGKSFIKKCKETGGVPPSLNNKYIDTYGVSDYPDHTTRGTVVDPTYKQDSGHGPYAGTLSHRLAVRKKGHDIALNRHEKARPRADREAQSRFIDHLYDLAILVAGRGKTRRPSGQQQLARGKRRRQSSVDRQHLAQYPDAKIHKRKRRLDGEREDSIRGNVSNTNPCDSTRAFDFDSWYQDSLRDAEARYVHGEQPQAALSPSAEAVLNQLTDFESRCE